MVVGDCCLGGCSVNACVGGLKVCLVNAWLGRFVFGLAGAWVGGARERGVGEG